MPETKKSPMKLKMKSQKLMKTPMMKSPIQTGIMLRTEIKISQIQGLTPTLEMKSMNSSKEMKDFRIDLTKKKLRVFSNYSMSSQTLIGLTNLDTITQQVSIPM